ncbi:hypothetical protein PFISCL1PPCAC_1665, partial [Pristionchus fissidentatus]
TDSDDCTKVVIEDIKLSCEPGYNMEAYIADKGVWVPISVTECFGTAIKTIPSFEKEPDIFRCRTQRKCDIQKYSPDPSDCPFHKTCTTVNINSPHCPSDAKLQASFAQNEYKWEDVDSIACQTERHELVVSSKGNSLPSIPFSLRC